MVRADTQEALLDELDGAAKQMGAALRAHYGRERPTRWQPWVLFGAGAVSAGVGAVFLGQAASAWATLNGAASVELPPSEASALSSKGNTSQWLGVALVSAGALAMAGGLLWYALGDAGPSVAVGVAPGAALVTLRWSFR